LWSNFSGFPESGVKKIVDARKPIAAPVAASIATAPVAPPVAHTAPAVGADMLIRRAYVSFEDGDKAKTVFYGKMAGAANFFGFPV
jgi:hypothetical protein